MTSASNSKIQTRHLTRNAYLYVRQSTLRQVLENTESTKRQYDLRQRAVGLGWRPEQVVVIDTDLGQSGASAVDREGFQRLVAEVSMGRAGIVMGLEVSRLARNSTDWHRLLEICALTDALILDEDGIYDPAHFNDRLLLGLKGTMSEAELHVLRARLRGGILNKARRGELEVRLPIGFVYDDDARVHLDSDARVQQSIRHLFRTFRRTGSATATVKAFREEGLQFPRRVSSGIRKGEVLWAELEMSRVLWILHHPRFAGAFSFGRTRQRKRPDGRVLHSKLPQAEWTALIRDSHEAYITWDEYEENVRRLRDNAQAHGEERKAAPPREGPALLQGIALCGLCGNRMSVRYHHRRGATVPDYLCQQRGLARAEPYCQQVNGAALDAAIGRLIVETVTPLALEVALAVQAELEERASDVERLRQQDVERARYEAELARRRYMQVDPGNRLVADSLEAEWNERLRALADSQRRYEQKRDGGATILHEEQRARILALASDVPRLWNDARTPHRDRKRLARLLIDDVTLRKTADDIAVHVRFRGGATRSCTLPLPKPNWMLQQTPSELVADIDSLLDSNTEAEIALLLRARGVTSGTGRLFHSRLVSAIRQSYNLKPRYERLLERGMLTQEEMAAKLDVTTKTLRTWRRHGLLRAHAYDRKSYVYEPAGLDAPIKNQHKIAPRRQLAPYEQKEVQCEA